MKTKNRNWLCPLIVMGLVLILTHSCKKDEDESGSMTDKDGNVYTSVTIGTQVWMVENLKTTKYNDNTAIPLVTDNTAWTNLSTPGYCWYDNDASTYKVPYGALYNWYAVETGKLCPSGWHVPSDAEWTTLATFLGGESVAGNKLKEMGTTHWYNTLGQTTTDATNEYGFTALGGGMRYNDNGRFDDITFGSGWWSSSESSTTDAWGVAMTWESSSLTKVWGVKRDGAYVRCLKN
jgi:uncharacterized protein (TIGR02145 family)